MSGSASVVLAPVLPAGLTLCLLGAVSVRREQPGSLLFGAYVGLWGAVPLVDAAGSVLFGVSGISGLIWIFAVVPWVLFSLRYTGRPITRRRWLFAGLPAVAAVPWFWSIATGANVALLEVAGILVFVYYAAVAIVGALLILQAANRYGHISVRQGTWLALAGVLPAVTMNVFGVSVGRVGDPVLFGMYTTGVVASVVVVVPALSVDDVFDASPAAGTVGERAVLRESDDVIVITDDRGRVIQHNEQPATLTAFTGEPAGQPIDEVLDYGVEALSRRETVSLRTDEGVAQFDPQVTALTDQHDRRIGSMLSLREVTERERRRQRLEVLNRIVRHNLRNQTSVIKANTEAVTDELDDDRLRARLETAMDAADSLTELGTKAKRVQTILAESNGTTRVELTDVLETIAADAAERWPAATVLVDAPEAEIQTDRQALVFALSNLVENAVEHADGDSPTVELSAAVEPATAYPVTITVDDDGPGIPDREVDVLEAGTETPLKHGSGIGLWVTNWTVGELGGELAFPERGPDGTTAAVRLPT